MALGLGWAFVRYVCRVFFCEIHGCFDEVVVVWWRGRAGKGRVGGGIGGGGGGGGERRRRKKSE